MQFLFTGLPAFRCDKDEKALQIIQNCFPDREVIGIDSIELSGDWEASIALVSRNLRSDIIM